MPTTPTLTLVGPTTGAPTLADLIALARQLTGREPTSAEIAAARTMLASSPSSPAPSPRSSTP